jgi:dipeptidyl aminopeptidase/acylaminoacyl peptidase
MIVFCLGLSILNVGWAMPLPGRHEIFAWQPHHPQISASGSWVANIVAGDTRIRLLSTVTVGQEKRISLSMTDTVLWHRWTNSAPEQLLIVGQKAGREMVLAYDPIAEKIRTVDSPGNIGFFSYAHYLNDYKFTLARYRNKEAKKYYDLTPTGNLQLVNDFNNAIPAYLQQERGFLDYSMPYPQHLEWQFGLDKDKRVKLLVPPQDDRQGTNLMSVSTDNKAYMLTSVAADTLGLAEYDLASGEKKLLAQEKVDISRLLFSPLDGKPDGIMFESESPQLRILDPRIKDDIAALSANDWNLPVIKDRSPNDQFWLVQYPYKDGGPKWVWYDRQKKQSHDFTFGATGKVADSGTRIRSFAIKRPGQPDITGYVALPKAGVCESKKCPAVFMPHGGPGERDYAAHTDERTWLTSRGMIVINVNYRGSKGFGKQHQALDAGQWFTGIPKDALDGFQYALQNFPIDSSRVAIMGTSFAATLALHLMSETPHFQCGLIDSTTMDEVRFVELGIAKYGAHSDLLVRLGDPNNPADRANLAALSAVNRIEKLKTRSIFYLHGEKDDITPPTLVGDFVTKMLAENKDFLYAHLVNEGHGFATQTGREIYHALAEQYLAGCLGVPAEAITADEYQKMQGNVSIFGKNSAIFKKPE